MTALLPVDAREVPDHAYAVWQIVGMHLAELEAWLEVHHRVDGIWPQLELTPGHDVLCTARYDAEGICHEQEGCALVDELPTPPCTCWYVRASDVRHGHASRRSLAADCYCGAFVFWINVNCWHHGDGFRW